MPPRILTLMILFSLIDCKFLRVYELTMQALVPTPVIAMIASTPNLDFGIAEAIRSSTLSESFMRSDVVVVATMPKSGDKPNQGRFIVGSIKKGGKSVRIDAKIKTSIAGRESKSSHYLIFGNFDKPPEGESELKEIDWSAATPISESGLKELDQIVHLDQSVKVSPVTDSAAETDRQVQRMKYFWNSLQHSDDLIAANAHLEFAITSDIALAKFRPQMKREKLVEWLKSKSTPVRRQELYLAMLAKCGKPSDGDWIAPRLTKLVREQKRASMTELTSWIACYLSVKGDAGQELVSELFLDDSSNFKNTYDAVAAIRHVTYQAQPSVSKTASIAMFRSLLTDPKLADLVVMDLARLEDWESTARLVKMFKESVAKGDDSGAWIRLPIVNFLRLNPSMVSEDYLRELKLLDPKTFKKAEVLVADPESSIDSYRVRPERPSNFRFL